MRVYLALKLAFVLVLAGTLLAQSGGRAPARSKVKVSSTDVERILARFVALEEAVLKLANEMAKANVQPFPKPTPKPSSPIPNPEPGGDDREPPSPELLLILSRHCVQCHSAETANQFGGSFVMYEPISRPLGPGQAPKLKRMNSLAWVAIDYSVYSGDMPKYADPLPSDDSAEIRAYVTSIRDEVYHDLGFSKP